MSVSPEQVRHIAKLARIAVSDARSRRSRPSSTTSSAGSSSCEVDVAGVEPMTAVIPNKLRLRDDVVTDGGIRDEVLANAPAAEHGFFAVPKVIE